MDYRKLTKQLIARVRELQEEVAACIAGCESSLDYAHEHHARVEGKLRAQRDELERERESIANEASRRQYERADAFGDLERARRYDDSYAIDRALNHLKNL